MNFRARKLGHRGIMTGKALQISPANDPCGSPAKEQQAAGVGIILQIMMLVLSFVLGYVLRCHKFYYLPEASASLLIGCVLQEKEGLLELVEKGKIAARTEKSGQNASIDGCSHRDENPVVGAHKKCDRELFLLIFQDM
ncbi:hypothetical protein WN944_023046 [Citrus x changshan-huyou]|uniref:Uncharacterized protein n=1 Tax=Citrus x changshan-huyou TaxID=2935761 RepID=A0AAP0N548_9ROSI